MKNERDAGDLADLLRMGRLPEAWIAPAEIRELREVTRYRIKLVRIRTSCKSQLHAVLAKLGITVTCSDIFGVWAAPGWTAWNSSSRMGGRWPRCAPLTPEITVLEAALADLFADHDGYRAVQALPGIGAALAAVLVAEIGDITRFGGPGQLCSWAGLTPRHREARHHGHARAYHQAGTVAGALGADRCGPARPRRPPAAQA